MNVFERGDKSHLSLRFRDSKTSTPLIFTKVGLPFGPFGPRLCWSQPKSSKAALLSQGSTSGPVVWRRRGGLERFRRYQVQGIQISQGGPFQDKEGVLGSADVFGESQMAVEGESIDDVKSP